MRRSTTALTRALVLCVVAGDAHAALIESRSIDGTGNQPDDRGSAGTALKRMSPAAYPDNGSGTTFLEAPPRPNPRDVSNALARQGDLPIFNAYALSDFVWTWGQFVDHDIDLTETDPANGSADIMVSAPDPLAPVIPLDRSNYADGTGIPGTPREQVNEISAFIDASQVYGSDPTRAEALRTFAGGKLDTSAGDLLPFNVGALPNAGGADDASLFLAGDVRANEQIGLTALHTLFVREHNRWADVVATVLDAQLPADPAMRDEEIYQTARKIVGAQMQSITYNEFLPALLGATAPSAADYFYDEISPVDPSIANEFSSAFFRLHTLVSPSLLLVDEHNISMGEVRIRDAFFAPELLVDHPDNLAYLLKGMAYQPAQKYDNRIIDDLHDALFGAPAAGGMDLAAINIQRGREHGLPDYNTLRTAYGLDPVMGFDGITSDAALAAALADLYLNVGNIDPWVGAMAEDHMAGATVGPLVYAAVVDQFTRLRDGDRLFYLGDPDLLNLTANGLIDPNAFSLAGIIRANTGMDYVQDNVFMAATAFLPVPEPGVLALLGVGLAGLRLSRRVCGAHRSKPHRVQR